MVTLLKYQNKNIAIYGMGLTGFSAAKVLKNLKAKVICWDDNKKIRTKIKSSNFFISKFWLRKNSIDKIVISPGINIDKCKIKRFLKKNSNKIITYDQALEKINNSFFYKLVNILSKKILRLKRIIKR